MEHLSVADFTTPPRRSSAQLVAGYRYLRSFEKVAHADSVEFEHTPRPLVVECEWYGTRSTRGHGDLNLRRQLNGSCLGIDDGGSQRLPDHGIFEVHTERDSLFYGAGPRWTPLATHRRSPFAELLFGGRKVGYEVDHPELENRLLSEWNDGSGTLPHSPKRRDWSTHVASNGPSLAAGGGLDIVITRPFAWRLINVQYTHSWMGGVDIHPDNGFRITTEAVQPIGMW